MRNIPKLKTRKYRERRRRREQKGREKLSTRRCGAAMKITPQPDWNRITQIFKVGKKLCNKNQQMVFPFQTYHTKPQVPKTKQIIPSTFFFNFKSEILVVETMYAPSQLPPLAFYVLIFRFPRTSKQYNPPSLPLYLHHLQVFSYHTLCCAAISSTNHAFRISFCLEQTQEKQVRGSDQSL